MKKMHHMEIHLSHPHDGKFHGAEVQHHMDREVGHSAGRGMYMSEMKEPEKHHFGEGEGHDMLAHIANHLGISEMDENEPKVQEEDEHESEAD